MDLLLKGQLRGLTNWLISRMARKDLLTQWGVSHGMRVMGQPSPYDYLKELKKYSTRDISSRVTQDCLILAGSEDHFIPLSQFYKQLEVLTNARSVTGQIFTKQENAQSHCQVGNVGLAIKTMINWLDSWQSV